jgi:hypothetical protein
MPTTTMVQVITVSLTIAVILTALIRAVLLLIAGLVVMYGKTGKRRQAARDLVRALVLTTPRSVVSAALKPRKSTKPRKTGKA